MSISIVIPSYNGRLLLQKNLPAVIGACTHWNPSEKEWEIIVVDDASTDNTKDWLQQNYPHIKIVSNKKNLRFAKTVNRGVAESMGNIVVLLNNDVRPAKDFLTFLIRHFEDKNVFAVGCLERNKENKKTMLGGRGSGKFSRGFLMHWRAADQHQHQTLWVTAGSGAFRRSIWDKLHGFDPLFHPAYEEDRDLSYNALKAGYKIIFEPKSQVEHVHETSNIKAFGARQIKVMSFKNQLLFVWKNISSFKLLGSHLLWLPYHLIFTTVHTRGLFLVGFLQALCQLPEALISRHHSAKLWQLTDEQILNFQI